MTDELGCPDGVGRFNHFEGGSIYWTVQTGPHEVHGAIRDQWANMGWENCYLRYPTSDERGEGNGRYSQFQAVHPLVTGTGGDRPAGHSVRRQLTGRSRGESHRGLRGALPSETSVRFGR